MMVKTTRLVALSLYKHFQQLCPFFQRRPQPRILGGQRVDVIEEPSRQRYIHIARRCWLLGKVPSHHL
jgi:hypothetical protein